MLAGLLVGAFLILLSLWILAQDPTVQMYLRRMQMEARLRETAPTTKMPEDPVVLSSDNSEVPRRRR